MKFDQIDLKSQKEFEMRSKYGFLKTRTYSWIYVLTNYSSCYQKWMRKLQ